MSDSPASAYDMSHVEEDDERRTLAVIVDNEPGVLGRVVGLFFFYRAEETLPTMCL